MVKHCGLLTASSEGTDKGSKFTVYLPTYSKSTDNQMSLFPLSTRISAKTRSSRKFFQFSSSDRSDTAASGGSAVFVGDADSSKSKKQAKFADDVSRSISLSAVDAGEMASASGGSIRSVVYPKYIAPATVSGGTNTNANTSDSVAAGFQRPPDMEFVLIVDDVGMNRKILARLLSNIGYTCFEAVDGQQCVDIIAASLKEGVDLVALGGSVKNRVVEKVKFDLILMDFSMPRMDGGAATKQLRKMGVKIPIFGLTGNALQDDCDAFFANGVDDVLKKPFNVAQFHEILRKYQPITM